MERLEVAHFLADAGVFDGEPGQIFDGKGRAATGIAIQTRHDNAGEAKLLVERVRNIHRVLAGRGIHEEQSLGRMDFMIDAAKLFHETFVDLETARGVENEDVIPFREGFLLRFFSDVDGVLVFPERKERSGSFPDDGFELLDRARTIDVKGGDEDLFAFFVRELIGKFPRGRGLAGALKAEQQDGSQPTFLKDKATLLFAKKGLDLVVNDLDDHLGRVDLVVHVLPDGFLLYVVHESLDDLEIDVRFQQGDANFLQHVIHVLFVQRRVSAHLLEDARKFITQRLKGHESYPPLTFDRHPLADRWEGGMPLPRVSPTPPSWRGGRGETRIPPVSRSFS